MSKATNRNSINRRCALLAPVAALAAGSAPAAIAAAVAPADHPDAELLRLGRLRESIAAELSEAAARWMRLGLALSSSIHPRLSTAGSPPTASASKRRSIRARGGTGILLTSSMTCGPSWTFTRVSSAAPKRGIGQTR
jgi:hypothetical protein